jgi:hypothetical protein
VLLHWLLPQVLIFILFAAAVIEGALQAWAEFGLVFLGAPALGLQAACRKPMAG